MSKLTPDELAGAVKNLIEENDCALSDLVFVSNNDDGVQGRHTYTTFVSQDLGTLKATSSFVQPPV